MLKAVLYTNVLVSGLLKRGHRGVPDQILRRMEKYQLFCAEEILEETRRVLHYPRIQKKHRLVHDHDDLCCLQDPSPAPPRNGEGNSTFPRR